VYGSFWPKREKSKLVRLAEKLRERGFPDTDIVGGPLRPSIEGLDCFELSVFYLDESDVNFLVFSPKGKRLGVTTELDHVLNSPQMMLKRRFCVVLDEIHNGRSSIGALQRARLRELADVSIVQFHDGGELLDACYSWARQFCRQLDPELRSRV
jgi:hypothetical protein